MTFSDLYNFLIGWIKVMPVTLAEQTINQAIETIYGAKEWSFLDAEDYIIAPARITTGTVNVTRFLDTVVVSADLKTILDAIDTGNDVPINGRQLRTLSNDVKAGSIIYTITNYDSGTSTLTLNRKYLGPTNTSASVEIFKSLYNPPDLAKYVVDGREYYDFAYVRFLIDLPQSRKLYTSQSLQQLNQYDLNRTYRGNPYTFVANTIDNLGFPLFEMYPAPTQERVYKFVYKKKGKLLTEDDVLPSVLSYELLTAKIKSIGYEWIEANKSTFPELKVINASALLALLLNPNNPAGYPMLLQQDFRKDEELFPKAFLEDYGDMDYVNVEGGNSMWVQPPKETLLFNY